MDASHYAARMIVVGAAHAELDEEPGVGTISVCSLRAQARIGINGTMVAFSASLPAQIPSESSLDIHAAGGVEASLGVHTTVATPLISAGGKGSSRCRWTFEKADLPLFGRDIETWSIQLLPKRRRAVRLTMKVTTTERLAFVPVSRSTEDVALECPLVDQGASPSLLGPAQTVLDRRNR